MKLKKTLLAAIIGINLVALTAQTYAASKSSSSSRSSYSSSSRSSSYSSSSRSSSYSSGGSYSSSSTSSSTKSTTQTKPLSTTSTTTYKPVSSSNAALKNTPYKLEQKKSVSTAAKPTTTQPPKKTARPVSYSSFKTQKYAQKKHQSNFLTWVLLAWILSDSNSSQAKSSTETKEVVVDCKEWLRENGRKKADEIENLSQKDFLKIRDYCESVAK